MVSENGELVEKEPYTTTYTYDSQNQLIREDNQEAQKTWTWTYDNAGNILSKKRYDYTTGALGAVLGTANYSYDSEWGDLLTGYGGRSIVSDNIGNITQIRSQNTNQTYSRDFTWEHGRELVQLKVDDTARWSYTYDANGMRTSRTNGAKTYSYVYNGSQLTQMTVGDYTLKFSYDASGVPMTLSYNGTVFYYVTNLQGDVVALLNAAGKEVVRYTYDAWGAILSTTGTLAGSVGYYNPLRYRGYVYDRETDLYYLQSRYYDPQMGRFISADATDVLTATPMGVTDKNLFAYCDNNPVIRKDDGGQFWHIIAGAVVGAAVSFVSSVIGDLCAGKEVDWAGAGISAAFGAVSGALSATGFGAVVQVAGGAVLAGAENAIKQGLKNGFDKINYGEVAVNAVIGGVTSRSNGISKAASKHLNKQAAVATKRIVNSFKHDSIENFGKTLKKAGKYYFSQTRKIFYEPLFGDAIDSLADTVKKGYFKEMIIAVH